MAAKRFRMFVVFVKTFLKYVAYIREVFLALNLLILLAGCLIYLVEKDVESLGDGIYFAFITALSVGYGDITPDSILGKLIAVAIGFMGIFFVGLNAAVATRALADTIRHHMKMEE